MRYILIRLAKSEDFETRRRMFSFIHFLLCWWNGFYLQCVKIMIGCAWPFMSRRAWHIFFRQKKKKIGGKKIRISLFSFMTLLHLFRNPSLRKFNCHLKTWKSIFALWRNLVSHFCPVHVFCNGIADYPTFFQRIKQIFSDLYKSSIIDESVFTRVVNPPISL
jgi:hypothetical protein